MFARNLREADVNRASGGLAVCRAMGGPMPIGRWRPDASQAVGGPLPTRRWEVRQYAGNLRRAADLRPQLRLLSLRSIGNVIIRNGFSQRRAAEPQRNWRCDTCVAQSCRATAFARPSSAAAGWNPPVRYLPAEVCILTSVFSVFLCASCFPLCASASNQSRCEVASR